MFSIVVAIDKHTRGIGYQNQLLYNSRVDMQYFKNITTGKHKYAEHFSNSFLLTNNAIIMGRNTFESIGKVLPNRINIVVSNTMFNDKTKNITFNLIIVKSFEDALAYCRINRVNKIYVIGGEQIYNTAITHPDCKMLFVTEISDNNVNNNNNKQADKFFPEIPATFKLDNAFEVKDNDLNLEFKVYFNN